MLDQLIPLLGMRVDSKEIKDIFTEWNAIFPKRVTCSESEPMIKGKVERNCVRLHFGRGGNSRYLIPNPTSWEGGYFGIFTTIEFTKKHQNTERHCDILKLKFAGVGYGKSFIESKRRPL